MQPFQEQIDRERQKIAFLQKKIEECQGRIVALMSLGADDEIDRLMDKAHAAPIAIEFSHAHMTMRGDTDKERRKRIPPNWVALIDFLGENGKTFRQVEEFLGSGGASMTPGAARTGLMNYRKEFGFVENPRKGFYKATRKGLEAIEAQKKESLA
ncbi:hypothetical protein [Metallibacterium scheffleri]